MPDPALPDPALPDPALADPARPDAATPRPAGRVTDSRLDPAVAARLKRDAAGLVCAVVQDETTDRVLMVGWMDDEALHRTLTTGRVTFWSRSRGEYWRKGDTSGHVQYVRGVELDCDGDALLVRVEQVGVACHTGTTSCFDAGGTLPARTATIPAAMVPAATVQAATSASAGSASAASASGRTGGSA